MIFLIVFSAMVIWLFATGIFIYTRVPAFAKVADAFGQRNGTVSLSKQEKINMSNQLTQWLKNFGMSFFIHLVALIVIAVAVAFIPDVPIGAYLLFLVVSIVTMFISTFAFGLSTVKL